MRVRRAVLCLVVLGPAAAIAVISAAQDEFDAGAGIGMLGTIVLTATAWVVAWRRGAWQLRTDTGLLSLCLAGLIAVAAAGPNAVTDVVLAARGEPVDVVVAANPGSEGVYSAVPVREPLPVRGDLRTDQVFHDGERVTVLVDRGGFVRPKLPGDLQTVVWVLLVLGGAGLLVLTTLRFGFPLERRT